MGTDTGSFQIGLTCSQASSALRSDSVASSYYEPEPDDGTGEIDRQRLDPDEARMHFLPSHADTRNSDLAARISSKRRQYRGSIKTGPETLQNSDPNSPSEDDGESLERKVTRLRREILEVKEIFEKNILKKKDGSPASSPLDGDGSWDTLNDILDDVQKSPRYGAASKIVHTLSVIPETQHGPIPNQKVEPTEQSPELPSYTVTYAPTYQQSHALAKAADFDARLSLVETLLGVETIHLPTQDRSPTSAILPTLDNLDRQISTLSSSTNSSLDLIDRKVKQLTQDTQKLAEARTSARTAQDALNLSMEIAIVDTRHVRDAEESEKNAKINALYGTLPTIDSLAPLLPSVLDRLKSLQSVHAGAASASQNLLRLEAQQQRMGEELKSWREGLEKVEKAVEQGERTMMGNAMLVEAWVKELEDRMRKLAH